MQEPKQPLAEVFGFLTSDFSPQATRYRANRLCPFNNKVPNCTKDKAAHPLGVCSIYHADAPVMICPVRFHEDWRIVSDAADFFFPAGATWTSLTNVRLNDGYARQVATIDVVLVAYDEKGRVFDFGALEVEAVNTAGSVRALFDSYIQNPGAHTVMDWSAASGYPQPDYLASMRLNLAPRLSGIGSILSAWQKRTAVAIDKRYFASLPTMPTIEKADADMAWLVYDLQLQDEVDVSRYRLTKVDEVYTRFAPLHSTTAAMPGDITSFMRTLEAALN